MMRLDHRCFMMSTGSASRISQQHFQMGLGFYSRTSHLSSFTVKPSSGLLVSHAHRVQQRMITSTGDFRLPVGCLQCKSPREIPFLSDSSSQQEDDLELHSEGLPSVRGGIVALGKFDALHIGHRELAIQASKIGPPFLLSFVGMAEVLGWESRAPIVAKCDRRRVLSSWASYCGGVVPGEFEVEFSTVRHLTPRQFIEKLSKEFGIRGLVAAAGDASELVRLCKEYGLGAYIINSVMDKYQDSKNRGFVDSKERGQVSSTRVRYALAKGDMRYVSELLGRRHRLMLVFKDEEGFTYRKHSLSAPKTCLLNQPPSNNFYENCSLLVAGKTIGPCGVTIGTTQIHLESDNIDSCIPVISQDSSVLGIEFSDLRI
ncbi:FAD synthetase 2, chloroplastic isoform X2 [Malania oleifera]|uniref:FAD synthetase 2, chloroplastic isoform X2 n=1 Tax=Malania oleifera TaxID=397392 RepID=UPI0025AE21FC|nr:FAD synthetase 2, chloroplastic isoform X2 [Malania oleifera]